MNCPKCGWPGLIGGKLKQELHSAQEGNRIRMEDNAFLRGKLAELRDVLMKLAPHVAVQSRNPSVAPENRAELLAIEPEMLRVLLETK